MVMDCMLTIIVWVVALVIFALLHFIRHRQTSALDTIDVGEEKEGKSRSLFLGPFGWQVIFALLAVILGVAYVNVLVFLIGVGSFFLYLFLGPTLHLDEKIFSKPVYAGLFAIGLTLLIPVHGYLYSIGVVDKYAQRCASYPTLDEAIAANYAQNGYDPTTIEYRIKWPNRDDNLHIWYVIADAQPAIPDIQQRVRSGRWCGGSFYVNARQGWVGMPEHFLNAFGYLDFWMGVYNLYGELGPLPAPVDNISQRPSL